MVDDAASMGPGEAPPLTLPLQDIGPDALPLVGGKAANLGALTRARVPVPPGFCVTTRAFELFMAGLGDREALMSALEALDGRDPEVARVEAERMRLALGSLPVPSEVSAAVGEAWRQLGADRSYAVRSSATAEDLPGASFAGQQDTYLNVRGEQSLIDAVRLCWISLFTDRAVLYRARNGFGHRDVGLAVVVQRMVDPEVSGILFTADPVTGSRNITTIDAGFGLGEALVGGIIEADLYRVDRRSRRLLEVRAGDKRVAIRSAEGGGTWEEVLPEERRRARALDDRQALALSDLGDHIQKHFGGVAQDIEWCIAGGRIHVLQARPITSLFPIPGSAGGDGDFRVYLSFGHVQMMHDAMPRLAQEVWRLFLPVGKEGLPTPDSPPSHSPYILSAGSRLYLEVTPILRVGRARRLFLSLVRRGYPALADALDVFAVREELQRGAGDGRSLLDGARQTIGPIVRRVPGLLLGRDVGRAAGALDSAVERLAREAESRISAEPTPGGRIRRSAAELNGIFSRLRPFMAPVPAGLIALGLLTRASRRRWARDVQEDLDLLLRGLPGNVTTQMDLAVGDLTDLARVDAGVSQLLLAGLDWPELRGALDESAPGRAFLAALDTFLERYGHRVAGEIDISRPRWSEDPTPLLRVVAGGVAAEPGAHRRQHEMQVEAGEAAAVRLVAAAREGSGISLRGWWIGRLVRVARIGLGLREHPKFALVSLFAVIRREVAAAGELLAARGQIDHPTDVWHFGFDELAQTLDNPPGLDFRPGIAKRRQAFENDRKLRPPLVISSEGESPLAAARTDLPPGALAGTGASAGVVEGVARVMLDSHSDILHAGEILVAPFTDPGWTPLFVNAAAVVTEVGGLMTHGAVVAREYGIPAVVSVTGATELIRTGQRIRVDGGRGLVEIL